MEQKDIPVTHTTMDKVENPDAEALALPDDTQAALKAIAAEKGVALDADGNVAVDAAPQAVIPQEEPKVIDPVPTETPPVAVEPVADIPAKFQDANGQVDTQKLDKSSLSLDEKIAYYKEKEVEFQKLQNKVNNPAPEAPRTEAAPQKGLTQLEAQIAQDLMTESHNQNSPITQGQAIALAKVQARLAEARFNAEVASTDELRRRVEDNERTRELQGLIDSDPSLATPEMADRLMEVRAKYPFLNNSPEPWKAAYTFLHGLKGAKSQVQTPTPKGGQRAPATPVTPVTRVTPKRFDPNTASIEELEAEVKRQNPNYKGLV